MWKKTIFDENKVARLWAVDDDMNTNVALELMFFPTRPTVSPSGFGTQFCPGRVSLCSKRNERPKSTKLVSFLKKTLMILFIQITRPSDLRSLCLVSKQVSQSATPSLYRDLFLPFDPRDPGWTRLERLANSDGVFDGHVKSINLGSCDYTAQKFCKTLQNVIENLPEDSLRRFDFGPLARPTYEDFRRLFRSQQRLTNLKLDFSLNSPSISEIISDHQLMSDFYALESLSDIYIDFGADRPEPQARDFVYTLMKGSSKLRKVVLKALPELSKLPDASPDLPQSLLSNSFPTTLTHISLWYYTYETTEDLNLNEYPALTDLELIECGGVETLLDNYLNPTLKGFVYRHECAEQGEDRVTSKAIIELIKRMKTPKRLTIDCEFCFVGQETHLASAIAAHADNLEYLLLTCHTDNYGLEDEVSLPEAVSKCTRLKQLGMCFPINLSPFLAPGSSSKLSYEDHQIKRRPVIQRLFERALLTRKSRIGLSLGVGNVIEVCTVRSEPNINSIARSRLTLYAIYRI